MLLSLNVSQTTSSSHPPQFFPVNLLFLLFFDHEAAPASIHRFLFCTFIWPQQSSHKSQLLDQISGKLKNYLYLWSQFYCQFQTILSIILFVLFLIYLLFSLKIITKFLYNSLKLPFFHTCSFLVYDLGAYFKMKTEANRCFFLASLLIMFQIYPVSELWCFCLSSINSIKIDISLLLSFAFFLSFPLYHPCLSHILK